MQQLGCVVHTVYLCILLLKTKFSALTYFIASKFVAVVTCHSNTDFHSKLDEK